MAEEHERVHLHHGLLREVPLHGLQPQRRARKKDTVGLGEGEGEGEGGGKEGDGILDRGEGVPRPARVL
jgi:hypothetical protein